jgi:hypothetical protein
VLVATRSFIAEYDGEEVRLIAVRSHVIEGHELARRFPQNFKPAPGTEHHSRERVAATLPGDRVAVRSAVPAPSAQETPTYEESQRRRQPWRLPRRPAPEREIRIESGYWNRTVQLGSVARGDIRAARLEHPGVEDGGCLFARVTPSGPLPLAVSLSGVLAKRASRRYARDEFHDRREIESMRSRGFRWCGGWHFHLAPDDDDQPSENDVRHWSHWREHLDTPYYLGLIAVVSPVNELRFAAWVVTEGSLRGSDRVQRARVVTAR